MPAAARQHTPWRTWCASASTSFFEKLKTMQGSKLRSATIFTILRMSVSSLGPASLTCPFLPCTTGVGAGASFDESRGRRRLGGACGFAFGPRVLPPPLLARHWLAEMQHKWAHSWPGRQGRGRLFARWHTTAAARRTHLAAAAARLGGHLCLLQPGHRLVEVVVPAVVVSEGEGGVGGAALHARMLSASCKEQPDVHVQVRDGPSVTAAAHPNARSCHQLAVVRHEAVPSGTRQYPQNKQLTGSCPACPPRGTGRRRRRGRCSAPAGWGGSLGKEKGRGGGGAAGGGGGGEGGGRGACVGAVACERCPARPPNPARPPRTCLCRPRGKASRAAHAPQVTAYHSTWAPTDAAQRHSSSSSKRESSRREQRRTCVYHVARRAVHLGNPLGKLSRVWDLRGSAAAAPDVGASPSRIGGGGSGGGGAASAAAAAAAGQGSGEAGTHGGGEEGKAHAPWGKDYAFLPHHAALLVSGRRAGGRGGILETVGEGGRHKRSSFPPHHAALLVPASEGRRRD